MAFLAPLAAKGAAGAALAKGVTTGVTVGKGVAALTPTASGIFSAAQPALAGLPAALPSAVTPGIFAKAAPALGGLQSLTPTLATKAGPGLFNTMGMNPLAGMQSVLPTASKVAPNLVGQNQVLTEFARQGAGNFPKLGEFAGKVTQIPGADMGKSLLGQGAKFKAAPSMTKTAGTITEKLAPQVSQQTPGLVENIRNFNTALRGPVDMSYAPGAQSLSQNAAALAPKGSPIIQGESFLTNAKNFFQDPSMDAAGEYIKEHPYATAAGAYGLYNLMKPDYKPPEQDKGSIRPYEYTRTQRPEAYAASPVDDTSERLYFNEQFTPREPYKAAEGGLMGLAVGGPVETMAAMNAVGANTGYPMAGINTPMYSNPMIQRPEAVNVISPSGDAGVSAYSGEPRFAEGGMPKTEGEYKYSFDPKTNTFTQLSTPRYAEQPVVAQMGQTPVAPTRPRLDTGSKTAGGIADPVGGSGIAALRPAAAPVAIAPYQSPEQQLGLTDFYSMMNRQLAQMGGYNGTMGYAEGGGVSDLGGYSDGGRLLKGPGDGVSDSIPAVIGERQPARLADGEFVVPARIVSELGNGSTEAGARKLYAMMDRVQKARRKTVGKNRVAANTRADKHLPA